MLHSAVLAGCLERLIYEICAPFQTLVLHGLDPDTVPREIVVQVCAFEVPPR
jgi:hypothetical protein